MGLARDVENMYSGEILKSHQILPHHLPHWKGLKHNTVWG